MQNKKNILFWGCVALFFPGSFVFGFPGVMAGYWQDLFQVSKAEIGRLMFFVLAGTGISMFLAGKLLEKLPVHWIIVTGSLACGISTAFVAGAQNIWQVYAWTFAEGFFCGFVYIPCLAFFQRMFPHKKGLVTGIMNLTFGGASAVMSPVFTYLLISKGYAFASYTAAVLAIIFGGGASLLIKDPDDGHAGGRLMASTLSVAQIVQFRSFWLLWWVWALAGAAGVSLIVLSAVFGRHLGYDVTRYVYILTSFNILNGIGRLVCGRLSDTFPKQKILAVIFLMAAAAYVGLAFSQTILAAGCLAAFIGLAFGGMFTVSAPLATEVFGLENFGKIFGLVFTAYGYVAGILGPWLSGIILDITDSGFPIVFGMFAVFYVTAAFLVLRVRKISWLSHDM